jgi:hypothetical protein
MQHSEIQDVLRVKRILDAYTGDSGEAGMDETEAIAALMEWRDQGRFDLTLNVGNEGPSNATVTKRSRGKAKDAEVQDDSSFEPTPDPSESSDSDPDF